MKPKNRKNSLTSLQSRRSYQHVLRYRMQLKAKKLAASTINAGSPPSGD
jgi:hypothetical protein